MMRLHLTTLALVAACGLFVLGAVIVVDGASARSVSSGARRADAAATRTWRVSLSPGPGDLALAQISFPAGARQLLTRRSLQVAVSGPFGDDYLATATLRVARPQGPMALVLLVNRPSPLLDPVTVRLRVTARRSLGTSVVRRLADPFRRPAADPAPALCDLRRHDTALAASDLSALGARGTSLVGFSAASAVAQAYDVACGLPSASSFEQVVERTAPIGRLPGEGCQPSAGRACPLELKLRAAAPPFPATGGPRPT
jgi:hypothetical protein